MTVLVGAPAGLLQAPHWAHQAVFNGFIPGTDQFVIKWDRSAIDCHRIAHSLAHASCVGSNRLLELLIFSRYSGIVARHGPAWADGGKPTLAEEPSPFLPEDDSVPCCESTSTDFFVGLRFWGLRTSRLHSGLGCWLRCPKVSTTIDSERGRH